MSEKIICDVKGCGKVSEAFFELVKTEPVHYLIFLTRTDYQTKLMPELCREHYEKFFETALDILKGK